MTRVYSIISWLSKLPAVVKLSLAFASSVAAVMPLWEYFNPSVEIFDSEYVYFNGAAPVNEKFIKFLRRNDGETVEINTLLDFSVALSSHSQTLFDCNNAYYPDEMTEDQFLAGGGNFSLLNGYIFNRNIEIPRKFIWPSGNAMLEREGCSGTLQIRFVSDQEKAYSTHGGTGLVFHRVRGTFDVHRENSGANERLILIDSEG